MKNTQGIDPYEALDGVKEELSHLEETPSKNDSEQELESDDDKMTLITQSQAV